MIYVPCKDCTKRQVNCHSNCDDYAAFIEENEYRKKQLREYNDMKGEDIERMLKNNKHRGRR